MRTQNRTIITSVFISRQFYSISKLKLVAFTAELGLEPRLAPFLR